METRGVTSLGIHGFWIKPAAMSDGPGPACWPAVSLPKDPRKLLEGFLGAPRWAWPGLPARRRRARPGGGPVWEGLASASREPPLAPGRTSQGPPEGLPWEPPLGGPPKSPKCFVRASRGPASALAPASGPCQTAGSLCRYPSGSHKGGHSSSRAGVRPPLVVFVLKILTTQIMRGMGTGCRFIYYILLLFVLLLLLFI